MGRAVVYALPLSQACWANFAASSATSATSAAACSASARACLVELAALAASALASWAFWISSAFACNWARSALLVASIMSFFPFALLEDGKERLWPTLADLLFSLGELTA